MKCIRCQKAPENIESVTVMAKINHMNPREFIAEMEGTYDPDTGLFACDDCYIAMGQPSGAALAEEPHPRKRWRAGMRFVRDGKVVTV